MGKNTKGRVSDGRVLGWSLGVDRPGRNLRLLGRGLDRQGGVAPEDEEEEGVPQTL